MYLKMVCSGMPWTIISGNESTLNAGSYAYSTMFPNANSGFTWDMRPWMIAGVTLAVSQDLLAPLMAECEAVGFNVKPTFFEHDNFTDTWSNRFPDDQVGNAVVLTVSRLSRGNWVNPGLLNTTVDTIGDILDKGSSLSRTASTELPRTMRRLMPSRRDAYMCAIVGTIWVADASATAIEVTHLEIEDWVNGLLVPRTDKYPRLSSIKEAVDPWGLLCAQMTAGSEQWYITGQEDYLTK
ncbi:Uu.00g008680.m01.CDS01 [Anthostomella pinea]|uniref:Uu.00g008680.m01.CDS01 n=1 Tax=Anthostomella pinea TaxID=933095 RepID=A0AAI8VXW8_9PEZI|nr:Uu.00g008680.m01.CDS01 [Anthostomella pinea]